MDSVRIPSAARMLGTVAIVRHGARTPKQRFNTADQWPFEKSPGQLTELGWKQASMLGRRLRTHFCTVAASGVQGCEYESIVSVRTTESSRCIETAKAIMTGFFDSIESDMACDGEDNITLGNAGEGRDLMRYIEVVPFSHPDSASLKVKALYIKNLKMRALEKTEEYNKLKVKYAVTIEALEKLTGWTSTGGLKVMKKFDSASGSFQQHAVDLPAGITEEMMKEITRGANAIKKLQYSLPEVGWRSGGGILTDIVKRFDRIAVNDWKVRNGVNTSSAGAECNNDREMVSEAIPGTVPLLLCVTHQSALMDLQAALGVRYQDIHVPQFASNIFAELFFIEDESYYYGGLPAGQEEQYHPPNTTLQQSSTERTTPPMDDVAANYGGIAGNVIYNKNSTNYGPAAPDLLQQLNGMQYGCRCFSPSASLEAGDCCLDTKKFLQPPNVAKGSIILDGNVFCLPQRSAFTGKSHASSDNSSICYGGSASIHPALLPIVTESNADSSSDWSSNDFTDLILSHGDINQSNNLSNADLPLTINQQHAVVDADYSYGVESEDTFALAAAVNVKSKTTINSSSSSSCGDNNQPSGDATSSDQVISFILPECKTRPNRTTDAAINDEVQAAHSLRGYYIRWTIDGHIPLYLPFVPRYVSLSNSSNYNSSHSVNDFERNDYAESNLSDLPISNHLRSDTSTTPLPSAASQNNGSVSAAAELPPSNNALKHPPLFGDSQLFSNISSLSLINDYIDNMVTNFGLPLQFGEDILHI